MTSPHMVPAQMPDVRLIARALRGDLRAPVPEPALKPLVTRRTVMVVDDEPPMLDLMVRILKRENYEILTADCGQSALRQAQACGHAIDLLVTDYSMPGISGRELAGTMREQVQDLPVLYQTGFTDLLFEDRQLLDDRSAFLEKPYTTRGLLEAVRFVLFGAMNPFAFT